MEFIGTFSLVFIGGWSVFAADTKPGVLAAALGHGFVLAIMIYIGAKISGAHYNPAVTIGLLVTNHIEVIKAIAYIISQLVGSLAAGAAISWLKPNIDVYKN